MASVFHHLLAALCFADLLFLISLVVVSPVSICIITLFLYFVILVTMMMMITIVVIHTNTILYLV